MLDAADIDLVIGQETPQFGRLQAERCQTDDKMANLVFMVLVSPVSSASKPRGKEELNVISKMYYKPSEAQCKSQNYFFMDVL